MRGKEEDERHEEGVEGMWGDGGAEKGGGGEREGEPVEEIAPGIDGDGVERREGDEEVGELGELPVVEEADVPVDGLDVGIDERQGAVAPGRGGRGPAEVVVGPVVVGDEGEDDERRRHTGLHPVAAKAAPDDEARKKHAVRPQQRRRREAQRRPLPLSSRTTQHSPVRQPAEQRLAVPRRYVLRRRAQRKQRQRRPQAAHLDPDMRPGQRQQRPRCVPGQDAVHDVDRQRRQILDQQRCARQKGILVFPAVAVGCDVGKVHNIPALPDATPRRVERGEHGVGGSAQQRVERVRCEGECHEACDTMALDIPVVLVDALVRLEPLLAVAARTSRVLAWADDWYASWLVLAAWSLLCLAAPALFRYAVPLLLALVVFLFNGPRPPPPPLLTDAVLQALMADLAAVAAALPSRPPVALPPRALLRAAAILTLPWLVLTHLLHTRLLLALIGSLFIVHRAPWACVLSSVLWRSAFVRAALYAAHAFLTGQPLPEPLPFTTTTADSSPNHTLRFLLTVHENQRWWVGLDWTAALIPSERPAWSSPALLPVSPPAAFLLPDPTTVHLPAPDTKSTIKRTASWKWVDPEWRLLVRTPGSSLSRICRPLPTDDLSSSSSAPSLVSSASRLFKPASLRIKAPSSQPSPPQDDNDNGNGNDDSPHQPLTDPDGWIYSDNKWENQSHSNSLGKVGYHLFIHTSFPH